jgi:hypothetical protein
VGAKSWKCNLRDRFFARIAPSICTKSAFVNLSLVFSDKQYNAICRLAITDNKNNKFSAKPAKHLLTLHGIEIAKQSLSTHFPGACHVEPPARQRYIRYRQACVP